MNIYIQVTKEQKIQLEKASLHRSWKFSVHWTGGPLHVRTTGKPSGVQCRRSLERGEGALCCVDAYETANVSSQPASRLPAAYCILRVVV